MEKVQEHLCIGGRLDGQKIPYGGKTFKTPVKVHSFGLNNDNKTVSALAEYEEYDIFHLHAKGQGFVIYKLSSLTDVQVIENLIAKYYGLSQQEKAAELMIEEKNFTGLYDTAGKKIMHGNIVHWTDGGDELSLEQRILTRWDRIAEVEVFKKQVSFTVIDSPSKNTREHAHTFEYGSFIYQETEKYLTVVAENKKEYFEKFISAGSCMAWVLEQKGNKNV